MLFQRLTRCVALAVAALVTPLLQAEPLKIGYSDWPGWVSWEVAIAKGWFKEAGVDVQFEWFEYVPSMEAFSAGKIDAVSMTNGDAMVTGANGAKSVIVLINDISFGNDMIIAKPGIESLKDLKGKKIGVEIGFVDHLLLLKALETVGLSEKDVTLVNMPTHQGAETLASGDVDAVGVWYPTSAQTLKAVAGSKAVYTSKDVPGLIYDCLAVNPASLAQRRDDWVKVVQIWDRAVKYIQDPATRADALEIMAARTGTTAEEYGQYLGGTKIMTLEESKKHWEKADTLASLYGSNAIVDKFNLDNDVYKETQATPDYIDPSLVMDALKP